MWHFDIRRKGFPGLTLVLGCAQAGIFWLSLTRGMVGILPTFASKTDELVVLSLFAVRPLCPSLSVWPPQQHCLMLQTSVTLCLILHWAKRVSAQYPYYKGVKGHFFLACQSALLMLMGPQQVHAAEQFPFKVLVGERAEASLSTVLCTLYAKVPDEVEFVILVPVVSASFTPIHQDRKGPVFSLCHVSYFFLPFIVWHFDLLMGF